MTSRLLDKIPSLDLNDFTSGNLDKKQKFIHDLGDAYSNIGFVAIKNHHLTNELQDNLYNAVQQFFNLPDSIKQKYEDEAIQGQRGYIGKMKEHAQGGSTGDLKEFFHIGQTIIKNDPETNSYPENIFVKEVPELKTFGLHVYKALENTGIEMLRAIALFLDLDENYFDEKVKKGNSILRPIHYFPINNPDSIPEDAVRSAEHTDINLITF